MGGRLGLPVPVTTFTVLDDPGGQDPETLLTVAGGRPDDLAGTQAMAFFTFLGFRFVLTDFYDNAWLVPRWVLRFVRYVDYADDVANTRAPVFDVRAASHALRTDPAQRAAVMALDALCQAATTNVWLPGDARPSDERAQAVHALGQFLASLFPPGAPGQ